MQVVVINAIRLTYTVGHTVGFDYLQVNRVLFVCFCVVVVVWLLLFVCCCCCFLCFFFFGGGGGGS